MYRPINKIPSTTRMFGAILLSFMTLIAPTASIRFFAAFAASGATSFETTVGSPPTSATKYRDEAAFNASMMFRALLLKTDRAFMITGALAPVAPMVAGIVVNTTVDENGTNPANCSLREAIVAANTDAAFGGCPAGSGEDLITFTVTGTITLTSALPNLSTSMLINGPGANQLRVSGDNSVRVFKVTVASPGRVSFSGLTISDGRASMDVGGGIYNENTATVKVSDSTLSNNFAVLGGGLANSSVGTFTVTNSTLSNNSAGTAGGIYNGLGILNLINSTLNDNSAAGGSGNGGGINTGSGTLNVTNSTFGNNSAAGGGGGIYRNGSGTVNVTNSTLSNNSASSSGGGINGIGGGAVNIANSIIALNTASSGPDLSGTMTSQGYNLIGKNDGSIGFTPGTSNPNGDLVGTSSAPLDPLLGPLGHNGGPTQTHRLLTGSPAIDKGKNFATDANNNPILTDQRGLLRPADLATPNATGGDASDIGAYELQGDTVQSGPSFVVNTPDDHDDGECTDGDCTLREAIIAANSDSDTSTITFDLPGGGPHIIQLTAPLDDLETDMNIQGPTDESVEVRGESFDNPYSIFTVVAEVSISKLTISNGAEFGFFGGGGILNGGFLTINDCTFTDNLAEFGGAIDNEAILTINSSTFNNNEAGVGGAVYNFGVLDIENSTFTANHAIDEGGAIDTEAGILTIVNSTISGNSSDGDGGGLLHCGDTTGVLTNVTITNNRADADGDASGVGGGISQVSANAITLRNTIVAGNFNGASPSTTPDDIDGPMDPKSSYNLIGTGGSGGLVDRSTDPAHGNQVGVANPGLGPLQNNGGPTFTHALLVGSPAFNAAIDMTSVNGNIDDSQTSFDVVDASGIPNCVGFPIRIDDEQMLVTCYSGNTLTVTRGFNGTTAAAHSTGASVNPPFDQRGTGFLRVSFASSDTSLDIGAFEVQEATPHHLAFNVQPSNTNAGATITPAVTVRILDAENNATTSTANVTLAIGTNPGGGTLSGTTTVAAVNGTATFSNLSINQIGSGYTLTASSAGLIGITSNPFNIITPASVSGTKTVSGAFTTGSTVTYTVVLSNGGPATQLDNPGPEFTDVLPSSLTLVSANATSGTATIGTNTVSWNGSLVVGGSVTITITATINNVPDGTTVSNQGTINYDADGNGTNESSRSTDDPTVAGSSNPTNFNVNDVNDAPDAVDDVLSSVAEDSGVRTIPISLLLSNDTKGPANESGQTLTLTGLNSPVGGTVSNDATNVYFTPTADYNGAANFQYTVTDNGTTNGAPDPKSDTATVRFTITEVNDAPTANNDSLSNVAENLGPVTIPASILTANDSKGPVNESGQTLSIKTVGNAVGGTASIVSGNVVFTPTTDYSGPASFQYTVEDNGTTNGVADPKTSGPATASFTVTSVNEAPIAVNDELADVAEDSGDRTIPFAVLTANDSKGPANESGQTLIVKTVSNAVGGEVSIVGGNVIFTPTANYYGGASFVYTVEDNGTTNGAPDPKTSAPAVVRFTVTEVNDAPTANNDTLSNVAEDSGVRTIPFATLTANDSRGPANESGQTLIVKTVSNAVGGTVSIVGGNVLFTPTANFNGPASFQYTVEDNGTTNGVADPKTSGTATASFNITAVADTPSVTNATTNANTQTTAGLVISRNPVDGPEVTHFKITGITGGTLFKNNGTTVINNGDFITFAEGNAGLKFTPGTTNGSFTVQASVSASDAGLGGGAATATITVNPLGGIIRFSAANYSVAEGAGFTTITVERTGDTSQAVTVDYASSDHSNPADFIPCTAAGPGFASSRCDFTTAIGTLRFAAGETTKTFNVLISQDNYVDGTETLELALSNPTGGAVFGVPSTAVLSITDDATEPLINPIDISSEFVRSQYHDFLHREPDGPGLAFWTDNIEKCNDPARIPAGQTAGCRDKQRESTAIAFFMSPEFQITGGFVYHLYKGSLTGLPNYDGGSPGGSLGRFPTSLEFMRDVSTVSEGIVVNNQISGAVVEANRNRLAAEFVQRPEFVAKYGGLNNTLYVQELFNTTGIAATAGEKQALVDGLTNGTETRASVLRKIVDGTVVINEGNVQFTTTYGQAFYNQEFRRLFVYMEYVGYLRRNPDAAGFIHWLGKLNFYNGDPFQAEMVRSFILSPEYIFRFGREAVVND